MNDDVEIWLLFAPFWILGIAALAGVVWHMIHLGIVNARAQAAGHIRKTSFFSRKLAYRELTDRGRHHFRRVWIFMAGMVGVLALGMVAVLIRSVWKG